MKTIFKILAGLALIVVVAALGLVISVTYLTNKSERQVIQKVSQIKQGTKFSEAKVRLGEPSQCLTNAEEIEIFGTTKNRAITTNSVMYIFYDYAIPIRWILIYTDKESQSVILASWKNI